MLGVLAAAVLQPVWFLPKSRFANQVPVGSFMDEFSPWFSID